MNVRVSSLVAGVALVLAAAPAAAQMTSAERTIRFGAMTGVSLPMGDFGDAVNTGWHLTGFVDWRPVNFPTAFRGEIGYHAFGSSEFRFEDTRAESKASMIPIVANVVYVLPSQSTTRFHLMGGLGLYITNWDVEGSIPEFGSFGGSDSETDFGINLGGGVSFPLGQRIDVVVEARFHSAFTEGENSNFIPLSIGLRF